MGEQKSTNKFQKNINKAESKRVKLYDEYKKKDKKWNDYIEEQKEKIHPYMVRKYGDPEFRKEIIREAIENNYPEESIENLKIYNDEKKWDLNVSDEILDKYEELQLYNKEAKKQKGFIKLLIEKIYYIFREGGDNE